MDQTKDLHADPEDITGDEEISSRQADRDMKLKLITRLLIRNVTEATEIRKSLERLNPPVYLTERSIYRYKAIIKKKNTEAIILREGLNKSIEELAFDLKLSHEEVLRELWSQYHKPSTLTFTCRHCKGENKVSANVGSHTKVSALKEIRAASEKWIEILQSLGLTFKAPDQIQLLDKDGNPTDPTINVNLVELNNTFIAFVKAKFQDPIGTTK